MHQGADYCLCSPYIIVKPPDFHRESCDPHPANGTCSTRSFGGDSTHLRDREYLRRKELRDDRRDIIPD